MKVSLNWLRDFLDLDKSSSEIAEILTSLGLEVEGWEDVKPSPVDLDKVLTGKVLECERIPETDHLSATKVDVGDGVIRSIVCGAPNVAAGQKVFVALPGANVFSKDGQLFTIGERKVKGVPSQGMICAQDELGIGHDHSGIMVLPEETSLGITAAHYLKQDSDTVIEIGLTPNRADATHHHGVARDLAAWLRVHEQREITLRAPKTQALPDGGTAYPVTVENTDACPRFTGVVIRNLRIGESPDWLKNRLLAVGQRPINNVVDITNYVRLELGQPLHAYDLAKVKGGRIVVKTLPAGTSFTTLDEQQRKLFAEDLMICDGDSTPMCIGGVFGGANSGVTDSTTDIFLESAYFNPKWIRRSMLKHGLRTDAAWSFEKGVDPNGCLRALERAAALLAELANGAVDSAVTDIYPQPVLPAKVPVAYKRVNALIGEELSRDTVDRILDALEIGREDRTDAGFTAVVPTDKPDVTREADVVEEVLRLYGLDEVTIPGQIRSSMEIQERPNPDSLRNFAGDLLAANGFNECMGMSLSNSAYYRGPDALLPLEENALVYIHNSANQGLDCMRPSMLFSGLEAIQRNQNRQHPDLRLFEFGKTYRRKQQENGSAVAVESFSETARLSIFVTGALTGESWQPTGKAQADFYTIKAYVNTLFARLGLRGYQETVISAPEAPFQYALRYHRGPQELATFGAVLPAILKKMDIRNAVFYADIHFDNVIKAQGVNNIRFAELNKYPSVRRDLALVLDQTVSFGDIRQLASKTAKKMLKDINLFDVFEDEQKLGAGKKSYAVSFTFEDPEKTLQDKEIDHLMQQLQQAFETRLKATIR
ncbi:MAG: phenylalanine--tRNA ligase subunit beta [Saprospiraceae bacterium]|nr:phenylalanine--tRNA ligase subunit beta [Saprospiraceae bacterium]